MQSFPIWLPEWSLGCISPVPCVFHDLFILFNLVIANGADSPQTASCHMYDLMLQRETKNMYLCIRVWSPLTTFKLVEGYNKILINIMRVKSWWRHCATCRKVAGLISSWVIGIFQLHNPSGSTVPLGSTQSLNRNDSHGYLLRGKGGRCVGLITLSSSCDDI